MFLLYEATAESALPGTCQLKFYASGKYVEQYPFFINIAPDAIRDMFGLVIEDCVHEQEFGGFVTRNLERTTSWVMDPENIFPPEPADMYYLRKRFSFIPNLPSV